MSETKTPNLDTLLRHLPVDDAAREAVWAECKAELSTLRAKAALADEIAELYAASGFIAVQLEWFARYSALEVKQ